MSAPPSGSLDALPFPQRLAELDGARTTLTATLTELERRAGEDAAMREAVARCVGELQSHYPARFSTALDAASRARPKGIWLTRFCWTGAEVKAEGRVWGSAPATEFAGRLARSPHFGQVFTVPTGSGDGTLPAGSSRTSAMFSADALVSWKGAKSIVPFIEAENSRSPETTGIS